MHLLFGRKDKGFQKQLLLQKAVKSTTKKINKDVGPLTKIKGQLYNKHMHNERDYEAQ